MYKTCFVVSNIKCIVFLHRTRYISELCGLWFNIIAVNVYHHSWLCTITEIYTRLLYWTILDWRTRFIKIAYMGKVQLSPLCIIRIIYMYEITTLLNFLPKFNIYFCEYLHTLLMIQPVSYLARKETEGICTLQ